MTLTQFIYKLQTGSTIAAPLDDGGFMFFEEEDGFYICTVQPKSGFPEAWEIPSHRIEEFLSFSNVLAHAYETEIERVDLSDRPILCKWIAFKEKVRDFFGR